MGRKRVGAVEQDVGSEVVADLYAREDRRRHLIFRHYGRSDLSAEALAKAEAVQNLSAETVWIASSQELLAMTRLRRAPGAQPSPLARPAQIARTNIRKPGAPMIASNPGSRFSSAKTNPALA